MTCNKCESRVVSNADCICLSNNKIMFLKKTWKASILAILINGILILSSYNYVQYLAYKKNIQIIKLENYKNEETDIKQTNTQF